MLIIVDIQITDLTNFMKNARKRLKSVRQVKGKAQADQEKDALKVEEDVPPYRTKFTADLIFGGLNFRRT